MGVFLWARYPCTHPERLPPKPGVVAEECAAGTMVSSGSCEDCTAGLSLSLSLPFPPSFSLSLSLSLTPHSRWSAPLCHSNVDEFLPHTQRVNSRIDSQRAWRGECACPLSSPLLRPSYLSLSLSLSLINTHTYLALYVY